MSEANEPFEVADSGGFGVAISGGGTRACLFALGGILAIEKFGYLERVATIASVSGGSFANAYLQTHSDGSRLDHKTLKSAVIDAVDNVGAEGVVTKGHLAFASSLGLPIAGLGVGAARAGLTKRSVALVGALGLTSALAARGHAIRSRLLDLLGHECVNANSTTKSVDHVYCATDLSAGMPAYFRSHEPHFYSPTWGTSAIGVGSRLPLATAVAASSAFPGLLAPQVVDTEDLELSRSGMASLIAFDSAEFKGTASSPRRLFLSDGGAWNNLATDWFAEGLQSVDSGFITPQHTSLLVIDATAPPKLRKVGLLSRVPIVGDVFNLRRVLGTLYESTVESRAEAVRAAGIVSGRTFLNFDRSANNGGTAIRSSRVVRAIEPIGESELPIFSWEMGSHADRYAEPAWLFRAIRGSDLHYLTSGAPTTLLGFDRITCYLMLVHGYVSTLQCLGKPYNRNDRADLDELAELCGVRTQAIGSSIYICGRNEELPDDQGRIYIAAASLCAHVNGMERVSRRASIVTSGRPPAEVLRTATEHELDTIANEHGFESYQIARTELHARSLRRSERLAAIRRRRQLRRDAKARQSVPDEVPSDPDNRAGL